MPTFFGSLTKFNQIRRQLGLVRTCQQGHTPETIREAMMELWEKYPRAGARDMISLLFHEMDMCVSRFVCIISFSAGRLTPDFIRSVIRDYFATYEPHLVRQRKAGRLQR